MTKGSPLPWYKEGLRFECTQCGQCCTGSSGFVFVEDDELDSMAISLDLTVEQFKRKYLRLRDGRHALVERKNEDHDCIFLKDKKCSIYKARPKQCRTFPWWRENLDTEESWASAALFCEGIRVDAPVVPFEEINKNTILSD